MGFEKFMNYGFIKITAVSPEVSIGDVKINTDRMIDCLHKAAAQDTKVLVFPELSITGYTCADLFFSNRLLRDVEEGLQKLKEASVQYDTLCLVGAPVEVHNRLYNCAVALQRGKILAVVPKTSIPNYGEYYESRYFAGAESTVAKTAVIAGDEVPFGRDILLCCAGRKDFNVGIELCEDLWSPLSPSTMHAMNGATVICNLSASNEYIGKEDYRRKLIEVTSNKLKCAYLYCSSGFGESSTDLVFDGNKYIAETGELLCCSDKTNEAVSALIDVEKIAYLRRKMDTFGSGTCSMDYRRVPFVLNPVNYPISRYRNKYPFFDVGQRLDEVCSKALKLQSDGLYQRLKATGLTRMILGISGGLDSTLAMLVCVNLCEIYHLSKENIIAYTMPCFGTSGRTLNSSKRLCEALGVHLEEIPIKDLVTGQLEAIGHNFDHDVAYENTQARQRTMLLMNAANHLGGLLIGTGDLSEAALGFCTYGGDQMAMYNVNGSVPKSMVKEIVRWYASTCGKRELEEVLTAVIETGISPELIPADECTGSAQLTEDIVGNYTIIDYVMFYHLVYGFDRNKLECITHSTFESEFGPEEIQKAIDNFFGRFYRNQFKRSCMPDGVKVTQISFSPRGDFRLPSDK